MPMQKAPETLDFASMNAAFKRVKVHLGLIINEVRITGQAAHFVRKPFSMKLDQPAAIEAEILQADVQNFLSTTAPGGLQNFQVRMDAGKIFVDATFNMLISVPVSATCSLRIDQGKRLFIDLEDVSVLGGAPRSMVQKQLDAINPIFDLDEDLPVEGNLDSVDVAGGRAILRGRLEPKLDS